MQYCASLRSMKEIKMVATEKSPHAKHFQALPRRSCNSREWQRWVWQYAIDLVSLQKNCFAQATTHARLQPSPR
jgi:hypothetical protein